MMSCNHCYEFIGTLEELLSLSEKTPISEWRSTACAGSVPMRRSHRLAAEAL